MKIELGKHYKDLLTGFKGIAVGLTEHITGCDQVNLMKQATKDAKAADQWIDINCVKLIRGSPLELDNPCAEATSDFEVELGKTYTDKISGIKGVAIQIVTYVFAARSIGLIDKDNEMHFFQITRLQEAKKKKIVLPELEKVEERKKRGARGTPSKNMGML